MSILLNALNKHKDNNEKDEIDELIDNPIEETEEDDKSSQLPYLVIGLLAAIIFLLIVIIVLLIREPAQSNQAELITEKKSNQIEFLENNDAQNKDAKNKQLSSMQNDIEQQEANIGEERSSKSISETSLGQNATNVAQQNQVQLNENNLADKQANKNTEPLTQNSESVTNSNSQRFIEEYKPRKYSTEDLKASRSSQQQKQVAPENEASNNNGIATREYNSEQGVSGDEEYRTHSSGNIDTSLPVLERSQLTEIQLLMVNEVNIGAHIYSEDENQRFVFVDGNMKVEGEKLVNSWYLEKIEPDGVIINNNILRVRLPQ
ncbi:MAG: general secretion pathway protein GspB [Gammaproteobacteria bacterium]|nr:general secretion pathway protein GspB [Gammaproteobacteria bacterium]